jgi:hypothetical protein
LGDYVAPTENTAGDALEDQEVEKVTAEAGAIGRVARRESSAANVMVAISSTVMGGGV